MRSLTVKFLPVVVAACALGCGSDASMMDLDEPGCEVWTPVSFDERELMGYSGSDALALADVHGEATLQWLEAEETAITFAIGEPTLIEAVTPSEEEPVCADVVNPHLRLEAPLTVETADGRLAETFEIELSTESVDDELQRITWNNLSSVKFDALAGSFEGMAVPTDEEVAWLLFRGSFGEDADGGPAGAYGHVTQASFEPEQAPDDGEGDGFGGSEGPDGTWTEVATFSPPSGS